MRPGPPRKPRQTGVDARFGAADKVSAQSAIPCRRDGDLGDRDLSRAVLQLVPGQCQHVAGNHDLGMVRQPFDRPGTASVTAEVAARFGCATRAATVNPATHAADGRAIDRGNRELTDSSNLEFHSNAELNDSWIADCRDLVESGRWSRRVRASPEVADSRQVIPAVRQIEGL